MRQKITPKKTMSRVSPPSRRAGGFQPVGTQPTAVKTTKSSTTQPARRFVATCSEEDIRRSVLQQPVGFKELVVIDGVPTDKELRGKLGSDIINEIAAQFCSGLESPYDSQFAAIWNNAPQIDQISAPECESIWNKFDEFLVERALTIGPAVLLSDAILRRMFEWWKTGAKGPELFKRLGANLATSTVQRQGGGKPLSDPKLPPFVEELTQELHTLKEQIIDSRPSWVKESEIPKLIEAAIQNAKGEFPRIKNNWSSLRRIFQNDPGQARQFIEGTWKDSATVNELLARSHRIKETGVPAALSRMRRKKQAQLID